MSRNTPEARGNLTDSRDSYIPRRRYRRPERKERVPTYLVERYWPGVTIERLLDALRRSRQVMEQMSSEGTRLRHITTTLIPGEEVVLSVYEGPSAVAVAQLNERADILVSRIVDAIAVIGDQEAP
jgi:hypothetical protein